MSFLNSGTIKCWYPDRGFGFIEPDADGERDVFLHVSLLQRSGIAEAPSIGSRFHYTAAEQPDGRLRVTSLQVAE